MGNNSPCPHTIVTVDGRQVMRASGISIDLPAFAKAAIEGDELLAVWGLAWSSEPRRCWLFFHVENYRPGFGFVIKREAERCFRYAAQLGETEIYTPRDTQYPSSKKLMKMLKFEFFAMENGEEIWRTEVGPWRS